MQHHHGDDFPTHRQFLEEEQESFCDVVEREGNSQSWKEVSGRLQQAANFIWRSRRRSEQSQGAVPPLGIVPAGPARWVCSRSCLRTCRTGCSSVSAAAGRAESQGEESWIPAQLDPQGRCCGEHQDAETCPTGLGSSRKRLLGPDLGHLCKRLQRDILLVTLGWVSRELVPWAQHRPPGCV